MNGSRSGERQGLTARIVEVFLTGNLTPLLMILSLAVGWVALEVTPREEEPQIVVPLADVLVEAPGASAAEVEREISTRLEKLLYQIDGVEYVYSTSMPHRAVVTVRFYVGEDREDSLVKLHNKLQMYRDAVPPQVTGWVVRPVEIDDVPIVAIALFADGRDDGLGDHELRRLAEELEIRVQSVPGTGWTRVHGGPSRRMQVRMDAEAMRARSVSVEDLARALRGAAQALPAGGFHRDDTYVLLDSSGVPASARELELLVVGVHRGRPTYLGEVAEVRDGPAEREDYVRIGFGAAAGDVPAGLADPARDHPTVVLAVAKRKGTNAVTVSHAVQERFAEAAAELLPSGVHWRVVRDYGHTADEKVNELVEGLLVAVVIVVALIALTLGLREAIVVAIAVPITFGLTLLVNHLLGYSINRVTLFALTLALGLVVDDPIVDVENVYRHLRMGRQKPLQAVLTAVQEVRPPIILATLAVMVSFVPLFFITGMMGPYMAPMALNVPLAMFMSLLVAFTVTPWLSYRLLKGHVAVDPDAPADPDAVVAEGPLYRAYSRVMRPVLGSRRLRWGLLGGAALLLLFSGWLALDRRVPLKMLPFDNKNELQVIVDLPEGTTVERTEATVAEMAATVRGLPEATEVLGFAGVPSPMDFNGMVRHYYLRNRPHEGELRVNLLPKRKRRHQSHAIALRVRRALEPVAARHGARLKVVELPPGPPVTATVTVEVCGEPFLPHEELLAGALVLRDRLEREAGVVDVDSTVEEPWPRRRFVLDRQKAALHGVTDGDVARVLSAAVDGEVVATLHEDREVNPLHVELRLPRERRSSVDELVQLPIPTATGEPVSLGELGAFVTRPAEPAIYRKNLRRVAYVFAEVAGRAPAEVILDVQADRDLDRQVDRAPRPVGERSYFDNGAGIPWSLPDGIELSWTGEGEWKITLDAFRDLGLAFAAACFGIYVLLVHETKSYFMPLILMLSIPFTIIGIMPGFWLLNLLHGGEVAGVADPVFFTATAMIGMIALSGIAVRNSILLIEFLHRAQERGASLRDAVLQAGAVRFRPIFLTAGTAMLAAVPITLDPIFSGLAWALIFGLLVSSAFTLVLVPMVYFMVYGRRAEAPSR